MEELKELVIKNLEDAGVIDTMRAQLRSNVFKALQNEEGSLRLTKTELFKAIESETGQICIELFRDFLEFYKADFTLNVFIPECRLETQRKSIPSLLEKLGISRDPTTPLIFKLVQKALEKDITPVPKTISLPPLKSNKPSMLIPLEIFNQQLPTETTKIKEAKFTSSDEEEFHPRLSESDDISIEKQRLKDIEMKISSININPIKMLDIEFNIEQSQESLSKYSEDFE